jgi:ABC-type multidrug transport system permease subunit
MVSPFLYLITFGLGLGRDVRFGGGSYLEFVVSGIVAMNSMMVAFNSVASPVCMARILYMTFDEYQTAPINNWAYIIGQSLAASVRALASCALIIVIAWLFGCRLQISAAFILVLLTNCLIFSLLGLTAAMLVNGHEALNTFTTYIIMPMSFLCGTFFRLDSLPVVLKTIVELLPLTPVSASLRSLAAGGGVTGFNLCLMAFYLACFALAARKSMDYVRRQ